MLRILKFTSTLIIYRHAVYMQLCYSKYRAHQEACLDTARPSCPRTQALPARVPILQETPYYRPGVGAVQLSQFAVCTGEMFLFSPEADQLQLLHLQFPGRNRKPRHGWQRIRDNTKVLRNKRLWQHFHFIGGVNPHMSDGGFMQVSGRYDWLCIRPNDETRWKFKLNDEIAER